MSANEFDVSFKSFGKSFQEKILQALLSDHSWSQQMVEVLKPEYFEVNYLKYLFKIYLKHYNNYKVFPSIQLLATMVKDDLKEGNDEVLCGQIVNYLQAIKSNPAINDLPYVKDRSLNFCKNQALKEALEASVDLTKEQRYEEIVERIKVAITVGTPNTAGHDFFEDFEQRFVKEDRHVVQTGIEALDHRDIMNGGLGRGEIGVIMAATGVGKCTSSNTKIRIRHKQVVINGKAFNPWDSNVPAFSDSEINEIIERDVTIGELFDELSVPAGPCEIENKFNISVLSYDGFRTIEGFKRTEKMPVYRLSFEHGYLDASAQHLVFSKTNKNNASWKHLGSIKPLDKIFVNGMWTTVRYDATGVDDGMTVCCSLISESQELFDLQVSGDHSYYTNGVLSHNSHFLVQLGCNAMRAGKNVLHYTFELSETKIGNRYDSNFCGISATDILDEKEFIKQQYQKLKPSLGRLIVKEYPTNTASVQTLRAHIEKIAITKSFKPDVLIVDYADVMRSSRQFDSVRHEMKLVYEELRGLGMELRIPVWTASQTNRDATESDIVGLDKISESFGKAMVCDFIVTLSRKPMQKSKGLGNMFIPKNRLGKDGIVFPVKIDTARSIIEILDKNVDIEHFQASHENDMKQLLRDKWNEIANERLIELRRIEKVENSE